MNRSMRHVTVLLAAFTLAWVGDRGASPSQAQNVVQTLRTASVDTDEAEMASANFVRVSDTTEEFILDFGVNDEAPKSPKQPIEIEQRIVMSPQTAKRLLIALEVTIGSHERTFGTIEIDPNKRVKIAP